MNPVRNRLRYIVLLIIVVTLSLLLLKEKMSRTESGKNESVKVTQGESLDERFVLKNMPDPKTYDDFTFTPGETVSISGECNDTYRAVLIYASTVDYRQDPLSALYNIASECRGEKTFSETVTLSSPPFIEGESYYVIKAQQGSSGSWYNPY